MEKFYLLVLLASYIPSNEAFKDQKQIQITFPGEIKPKEQEILTTPNIGPYGSPNYFKCGLPYAAPVWSGILEPDEKVYIYYLNDTADKLASEGFKISVVKVNDDTLQEFTYTNGTTKGRMKFVSWEGVAAVGGRPADRIRAYYMAQLGKKDGENGNITWLCDGVLINWQWVLSAAHCFVNKYAEPNLIRLGDYNLSQPIDQGRDPRGKHIYDFGIEDIVPHPLFDLNHRYHDLVLIKLPRKAPKKSIFINPICLPWDEHMNKDLKGIELILTGWGATAYGGSKTDVLQQVSLEAFNVSKCQESYGSLRDFRRRYPKGVSDENILCVGSREPGKDACGGDSGAPLVFDTENYEEIVLAAIVSGGYGCGLENFPGIYIPITKPIYLKWIKEVAFKDYI